LLQPSLMTSLRDAEVKMFSESLSLCGFGSVINVRIRGDADFTIDSPPRRDDAEVQIGTGHMTAAIGVARPSRPRRERQRQPARAARERLRRHEHARGVASL